MDIYLAGAETPPYRRQLLNSGVTHVAISYYEWQRRYTDENLAKYFDDETRVCITAGVSRKEDVDWNSFTKDYVEFCERNAGNTIIYDMDAPNCPEGLRVATRKQIDLLPNSVVFPIGDESLADLAREHSRLGLNSKTAKSLHVNDLRRINAALYGSNVADLRVLRTGSLEATTTSLWLSARRYGELWVYVRGKLLHFPAESLT